MATTLQKAERYADQCEKGMLSALARFPHVRRELIDRRDGRDPLLNGEFARYSALFDTICALHEADADSHDAEQPLALAAIMAHMEGRGFWFDDKGRELCELLDGPPVITKETIAEYRRGMNARWVAREYRYQNFIGHVHKVITQEWLPNEHWEHLDRLAVQVSHDDERAVEWSRTNRKLRQTVRTRREELMAKGTTKEKATPEPIEDERIDAFLAAVEPDERDSLKRCIKGKLGGLQTREGSRTWEKAERDVAADLIRAGMQLKEIEWSEEG